MTDAPFDRADIDALLDARHPDPFACLGPHRVGDATVVRTLLPGALRVRAIAAGGGVLGELRQVDPAGCFAGALPDGQERGEQPRYRLSIDWPDARQDVEDAYAFGTLLDEDALARFAAGDPRAALACLGARALDMDGVPGVRFAVWAPGASRVSVVGDFNGWDARRHPMRLRRPWGVWELFVPRIGAGERYKFALRARDGAALPLKADPCACRTEAPPRTASIVADLDALERFGWHDDAWLRARRSISRTRRCRSTKSIRNRGCASRPRAIAARRGTSSRSG
ncbi:carbohydrate-binding module 48 family protein [Burkholderia mallei NCTC 10247]|nr:1,4-alpha-glucan branching enzyme [Burkholderia mallei SAVP1]AIO53237.1 carbohydrate-binding module 48 family protein [Burkholderia mallei]AIS28434.1 carbohydrate-binding module 48 family protein [Burkholderia mallei NCTC 10247]AIO63873.1 carbohydrate-binding module 48 family protein [Burkholderia mallei]AIP76824.1 carbohydrate-binding module 48 family protein [Burkholderia mallei]